MRIVGRILFVLSAFVWAGAPAAQAEGRVALVIGNQAYNGRVGPLLNPHKDIAIVGKALTEVGFKLLAPRKDASRDEILFAVYELASQVRTGGRDAVSFLYYAGHGVSVAGENVLVPTNAENTTDAMLSVRGVRLGEILDILKHDAPEAVHFVVLDACRNILGARGERGFVPVSDQRKGMVLAFSTAAGQTATDDGPNGTPYALALADAIVKPGHNDQEVFNEVRTRVVKLTRVQTPWTNDGLIGARVVFKAPASLAGTGTLTTTSGPGETAAAWALVKDSTDPRTLAAFRKQYGTANALYDRLAEARIEQLKQDDAARQAAEAARQAAEAARMKAEQETRNAAEAERQRLAMAEQAEAAKKKADDEARAKADVERVCAQVEDTSDLAFLNIKAGQYIGTPAADCIGARIDALALAAPPPASPTKPAPTQDTLPTKDVALVRSIETHVNIRHMALTQNDRAVMVHGAGGLHLWDLLSGKAIRTFQGAGSGEAMAVSPDGRLVLSSSCCDGDNAKNDNIKMWDLETGQLTRSLGRDSSGIDISPDGKMAASANLYGINLWALPSGKLIRQLKPKDHHPNNFGAAFSPDGRRVTSASYQDHAFTVWEVQTGRAVFTSPAKGGDDTIGDGIRYSRDGKYILAHGYGASLWDARNGKKLFDFGGSGSGYALTPDNRHVLVVSGGKIVAYNTATGQKVTAFGAVSYDNGPIMVTGDGTLVLSADDGRIDVWRANTHAW